MKLWLDLQAQRGAFSLNCTLELNANGTTVLFGPSGSGKSTLVRCLAGLIPCAGEIRFNEEQWLDSSQNIYTPTEKRKIGMVFQKQNLFGCMNVRRNLEFAAKRSRITPLDTQQILQALELEPLLNAMPETLSGGEEQRVALGRALLSQPHLLILDEPLSAVDSMTKSDILPYLIKVRRAWNIPMLYITHSLNELHTLAEHLVVLEKGRVVANGSVETLLTDASLPLALREDAGAILNCQVQGQNHNEGLTYLRADDAVIRVPLSNRSLQPHDPVRIRILAKDVSIALEKSQKTSIINLIDVTVVALKKHSDHQTLVVLALKEQKILALISSYSATHLKLQVGDAVTAQIKGLSIAQ